MAGSERGVLVPAPSRPGSRPRPSAGTGARSPGGVGTRRAERAGTCRDTAEHFAPSAGCPRGSRPNPSAAFFATVRIFPGGSCLGPGARSFPSRWSRSQPRPGPRRRSISRGHIRSAFSRQGPTRRDAEGTSRAADRVCGPPPSGAPSGGSSVRFGLPATPAVTATPGDGEVTLTWSLPDLVLAGTRPSGPLQRCDFRLPVQSSGGGQRWEIRPEGGAGHYQRGCGSETVGGGRDSARSARSWKRSEGVARAGFRLRRAR